MNLPFEVHFARMDTIGFELMHKPGKPPKKTKDYRVIEERNGRVFDVTFRCDDPSPGMLIYVMSGWLEIIPEWLEMISDDDGLDIQSTNRTKFKVMNGTIRFERTDDEEEYEDYEESDISTFNYVADGFTPDYLIVDADDSRLKIDLQGYKLNAKNQRIGSSPVLVLTEDPRGAR